MFARLQVQLCATFLLMLFAGLVCANESNVLQVVSRSQQMTADVTLDTRPLASCRQSTLSGAICLPIEDFVAPQHRLANWSGILWLLGTTGLTGNEHVAIVGEHSQRRDVLAGLLTIAGQKKISIIDVPVSKLLTNAESDSGKQRSTTRTEVYTAPMRSELLVLRNDLQAVIQNNDVILDGRNEREYYGVAIRAQRGGHIPGAIHSPMLTWQSPNHQPVHQPLTTSTLPVSYAHDPIEGLAYFTTLLAAGQISRLYLAGWSEYAADGALPIDSASYPTVAQQQSDSNQQATQSTRELTSTESSSAIPLNKRTVAIATVMSLCLVAFGFLAGKFNSGTARTGTIKAEGQA